MIAIHGFVTVLTQIATGQLVNWIPRKRILVILVALGLYAGCPLLIATWAVPAVVLALGSPQSRPS
jgi:hypothetical protein